MKHFLLFAAVIFVTVLPVYATDSVFSGGSGTSIDPYQITNTTDLTTLATDVNGGNSYAFKYFKQINSISYANTALTPIGKIAGTKPFSGVYDGAGFRILSFTISSSVSFVGIFGYVDGTTARIQNLGVTDATITSTGDNYTGGLVGYISEGTITKCYIARCTVTGLNQVGLLAGVTSGAIISQCYAFGGSVSGYSAIGGLIGQANGVLGSITDCYSSTEVTASSLYLGGLVGMDGAGTMTNCYSSGTIVSNGASLIGGLVGTFTGTTITSSYWDNTIAPFASSYGTSKTTTEMKTASTFTGWDGAIWKIDASINNGYPFLAWQSTGGSALPVELTSFTASTHGSAVTLHWNTATEVNNYGFDVEKNTGVWEKIGFVAGHGTTNAPQSYAFADNAGDGRIQYRLKQIDRDGKFEYSKEVELTEVAAPTVFALSQNYPNPFNPTTNIAFTVPSTGRATLKILNILGQEVATLFNGEAQAGIVNQVQFNATGLASGMYFSRLEQNGKAQMTKMSLLK